MNLKESFRYQNFLSALLSRDPIERSYDRMCEKLGGRIIGVRHRRALDMAGNVHDDKSYEILREDFLRAVGEHE